MTELEKTELITRTLAMSNEEREVVLMCMPSNFLVGEIYNRLTDGEMLQAKLREINKGGNEHERNNQIFRS